MHKTIILSLVLYGCETWSLTLGKKFRLLVLAKTESWGEYLGPGGIKMGSGKGSIINTFIVSIVHLI